MHLLFAVSTFVFHVILRSLQNVCNTLEPVLVIAGKVDVLQLTVLLEELTNMVLAGLILCSHKIKKSAHGKTKVAAQIPFSFFSRDALTAGRPPHKPATQARSPPVRAETWEFT